MLSRWNRPVLHNVVPINGRAGTEPRSTDGDYTAGPVRCIGGLCRFFRDEAIAIAERTRL
jgi:hypothetical protein